MANAVLIYTGNVCSTPMVSYAGSTGSVFVPFREEFDGYRLKEFISDPAQHGAELARTLSAFYARRCTGLFDHPDFRRFAKWKEIPPETTTPHTLFKWRPLLPASSGSARVAAVFESHDVQLFMLVRRSIIQQVLKILMTEKTYGSSHRQIAVGAMSKDDYANYMARQHDVRIQISADDIVLLRQLAETFLLRTRRLGKAAQYYFPHVRAPCIAISEDIFRPAVDRTRFDAVLADLLGEVRPLEAESDLDVRKGGLDVSHCANLEDVLADEALKGTEQKYQALIDELGVVYRFDA